MLITIQALPDYPSLGVLYHLTLLVRHQGSYVIARLHLLELVDIHPALL